MWLLCVGLAPAVLGLAWRGCPGDRLLLASLATFAAALALLDQTKAPLYSVLLLPSICLVLAAAREQPRLVDRVKDARADSVIVNINVRADVHAFPDALQARFWDFIRRCTTRVADLDDPTYFETEVYAVLRPPPEGCG